jgi:hypothetical protein
MPIKKLWEVTTCNASNGLTHGEHLWIIAADAQIAIRKALRFARKRYGIVQRIIRLEQHGTVDVL